MTDGTLRMIWVTVEEAAQALGLSERSVYRKIAAGELRVRKRGGRTLVALQAETGNTDTDKTDVSLTSVDGSVVSQGAGGQRRRDVGFDPVHHARQQVEAEEAKLRLRQVQAAHQDLDRQEAQRKERERQKAEEAQAKGREEALARERARQEVEERRRKEEVEAATQRQREETAQKRAVRRRELIQQAKRAVDSASAPWQLTGFTYVPIPDAVRSAMLVEVEKTLSGIEALHELPAGEVERIAEGIRDKHYRPVVEDAKRQEAEQERLDAKKRELIKRASGYAMSEVKDDPDLDPWVRLGAVQTVERTLGEELKGTESWGQVEARVDEILDEELGK